MLWACRPNMVPIAWLLRLPDSRTAQAPGGAEVLWHGCKARTRRKRGGEAGPLWPDHKLLRRAGAAVRLGRAAKRIGRHALDGQSPRGQHSQHVGDVAHA